MDDDDENVTEEDGEEEEEHVEAFEEEHEEVESILTEYDQDDFYSGAVNSLDSTIPLDLFEFEYSYGYNCHKYFNLCACDDTVVCWAAGSILTFMDVVTKQTWFRRSTTGGTIGAVASYRKDPSYRIAVAEARENMRDPIIILYLWPQMEIDAVLRDGTSNAYSVLDFSPDGELLASVGKDPDFNLTIWNWKRHKILLRTSAFTFDVNAVLFSPYCPGQLTTAGSAHIKFWKMATTFTGLKLKGDLGRFGKTEICDVLGVYPLPDEKVLSGCEWGNMLVWEAGLVKVEVTQKGRKTCHSAPIIQFMLSEAGDEITTIAQDGCVRVWYWDTVDQADPPEDDPYVELNPVAETCVPGCRIMCLRHMKDMFYYAQDGHGGIWTVELEIDKLECNHNKVLTCHAGGVVAIAALRNFPILITAGEDGALQAYDTENHILMARYVFPTPITCLLYPDAEVDKTSRIILVGFADGTMRTLFLHPERLSTGSFIDIRVHSALTIHSDNSEHADIIDLISILKPHCKAITQITINTLRTLLVTCGRDSTIFLYCLEVATPFKLHRLGFIETPNNIEYMTWKPDEERVLLLCGQVGFIMEAVLPNVKERLYDEITTFKLEFVSYKETLLKKHFMRNRPFPSEEDLASIDEEALKAKEEAEHDDDEEEEWLGEVELSEKANLNFRTRGRLGFHPYVVNVYTVKSHDALGLLMNSAEEWNSRPANVFPKWYNLDLFKPTVNKYFLVESESMLGTTVTWAEYCQEGVWVIQKGTGALILIIPGSNKVLKYGPFPGAWCEDITVLKFVCETRYLVVGTNTGYIRVVRMPDVEEDNPDRHYDVWMTAMTKLLRKLKGRRLAKEEKQPIPRIDFNDAYYLPMHDRYTGTIKSLEITADGKRLYTCGLDGNIFSYKISFPESLVTPNEFGTKELVPKLKKAREPSTLEGELMSHEQLKQKEEYDKMMAIANAHKKRVRDVLAELSTEYNKLIKANRLLPVSQQIDVTLDTRPLSVQENELDQAKSLTIRKLAHQLEASDLGLHKMFSRNIIQCDVFPFVLKAIREPEAQIRPLRQKNLSKDFYNQLAEVYEKMAEAALRGRRAESTTRRMAGKKASFGAPRVASFLLGLPPQPPYPLKKALRNYYQRLNRHHLQFVEWQEHLSRKPDPNAMPPGAANALMEAEATIGNRLLKTQPDYIAPHGHNTQLKVCTARKEIYDTKHAFNEKVLDLREKKVRLVSHMKRIGERLAEIKVEIPKDMAKSPPQIPEIDEDLEFPEKNLVVKPEKVIIHSRAGTSKKGSADIRKTHIYPQPRTRQPKVNRFVSIWESNPLTASWELLKANPGQEFSELENEVRKRRIQRHLYEQDMLLAEADVMIQQFDVRLRQLQRERIRVQEKNQLLELHLYQLLREMNVLNRFEAHEDRLAERVYAKLMQVKGVQEQIIDCEHRIDEHLSEKDNLQIECENLQRQFKKLVHDNKFADFLRRIFKKKYRPPRDRDDDDSSQSESSSSSSEEEDEGSMDSRDIGPIRLDPTVCPEGCDQEIYNKTYELRNTRHSHEQNMLEQDRLVDLLKKDIDAHNKVKRKLSFQLDKRKNDLREFMMEKQSCMNDVDQVVILRYDQIRASALKDCTRIGLGHTVVFPEKQLARLRKRVLELQDEIKEQKQRQKINRTHLFRMNIDLRMMESQAGELRARMRDVLTRKLGKPRKVDKTLDSLLKQMTRRHKFSATLTDIPQIIGQLRKWRDRQSELEQQYLKGLEKYSERLRLAAALQIDVQPIKSNRDLKEMAGGYKPEEYVRDCVRLRIVRGQQCQQIKALREEIQNLRLKPFTEMPPLPSVVPPTSDQSSIQLFIVPRSVWQRKKYFPIAPLGAHAELVRDVNVIKLLYDCLDTMRVTRDDASELLQDLTTQLPDVLSGTKSRYEVVDALLKKWSLRYGGDPSQYKKQTRAFDALAALADRLIKQHVETLEGTNKKDFEVLDTLEAALKGVADDTEPLHLRLGPAIAALFHSAQSGDIDTIETMTSLVNSLVDEDHPLTADAINKIKVEETIEDIRNCGVLNTPIEIKNAVNIALECLRAQILTTEESYILKKEVDSALSLEILQIPSSEPKNELKGSSTSAARSESKISSRSSKTTDENKTTTSEVKVDTWMTGSKDKVADYSDLPGNGPYVEDKTSRSSSETDLPVDDL